MGSAAKPTETKTEKADATPAQSSDKHESHHHYQGKLGPAARMLMQSYNIDPSKIKPTGPHGLITKR
jgi:pyruvate/2-oxoglutarate dehydrogenase complex dihydrolipoamide acyltransferase (E2) component